MLDRVLHTKRLKLRPVRAADAKDIAEGIGEWDVMRWLTSPPWPYTLADAQWYANQEPMDGKYGIEIDGAVRGNVSISQELEIGYWLAIPYHGHGYMTEAASALVAAHFAQSDETLLSGYLLGNAASANVLGKVGFENTHLRTDYSKPMKQDVDVQRMELSAESFRARHV